MQIQQYFALTHVRDNVTFRNSENMLYSCNYLADQAMLLYKDRRVVLCSVVLCYYIAVQTATSIAILAFSRRGDLISSGAAFVG